MNDEDFNLLSDSDDALYRAFGLLVRRLHMSALIETPDLCHDMRALADRIEVEEEHRQLSARGLRQIAKSLELQAPDWDELRAVERLYRPGDPGAGRP